MKRLNANLITNTFFPEYVERPYIINCGLCFEWAYIAYMLFDDIELWSNKNHAFIKYNGKFYDSESPEGVCDLEILNCNASFDLKYLDSKAQRLSEFVEQWGKRSLLRKNKCIINYIWK